MKLQGIRGEQKAIPAKDLSPGMVTLWNFGGKGIIKSISFSKTGKTLKAIIMCEDGKEYERTFRGNRLVAIM